MSLKRKLTVRTLEEKCSALRELENSTNKAIAAKYGVKKSTVSTWLKNKERYFQALGTFSSKRKKIRGGNHKQLDDLVYQWFAEQARQNVLVNGKAIKQKAQEYKEQLSLTDFHSSDGWLHNWKKRYSIIKQKQEEDESRSHAVKHKEKFCFKTNEEFPLFESSLPSCLSDYRIDNMFTADQFAIFYQCQPHETNNFATGGNNKFTVLIAASATGEKLPLLVIGKAKDPRCFENVKSLLCGYRFQANARMDSVSFEEWVRELDRRFEKENRQIALIVSNSPAHPIIDNLSNVRLIRLLPNTFSMKHRVVQHVKAFYCSRVVRRMIQRLSKGEDLPRITILQAMQMLAASWNDVPKDCIVNCFQQSKMSPDDILEIEDPFRILDDDLALLRNYDVNFIPEDFTAVHFVNIDANLSTTDNIKTETEFANTVHENDGYFDEPLEQPTSTQIEEALETLHNASLFSTGGDEMRSHVHQVELLVKNDQTSLQGRCSMVDFPK